MGSSMVTMLTALVALTWSIMEAMVVVLPEPVGPVTRTMPRGSSASRRTTPGRPRLSKEGMPGSTRRNTRPTDPRWRKTLTLKRPRPDTL